MIFTLFLIFVCESWIQSQDTGMDYTINEYSGIKEILQINSTGFNGVIVTDPGIFTEGDTVLFIEVKGAEIYSPVSAKNTPLILWGKIYDLNNTGIYALLFIERIAGDTIIFNNSLPELAPLKAGDVCQLVKIKTFDILEVNRQINCKPWDPVSGTGGVLVLFARHKIILNANIDASGSGFRGAKPYHFGSAASVTNVMNKDQFTGFCSTFILAFYPDSPKIIAGYKGESIVRDNFPSIKGFNNMANGGGGGNGLLSGGGGGSVKAH